MFVYSAKWQWMRCCVLNFSSLACVGVLRAKKNNINMYVIKVAEKDLYIYSTRHTTHVCIYSNDWLYWLLSIEPASNFPKETWFCCPIFLYNTSLDTCNQHGFSLLTYLHVCISWAKSSDLYQAQLNILGSL